MSEETRSDSGSFITGFTLGLFAGAAGLFLFGTEKGRKVKDELMAEWQNARASMPDRGEGLTNIQSLRDIGTLILSHIEKATEEGKAKTVHKSKKRGTTSRSKFKGT